MLKTKILLENSVNEEKPFPFCSSNQHKADIPFAIHVLLRKLLKQTFNNVLQRLTTERLHCMNEIIYIVMVWNFRIKGALESTRQGI